MTWFSRQRMQWIVESVKVFGFINSEHIERKFEVTHATASADIKSVLKKYPDLMRYNASSKRYELKAREVYIGVEI